MYKILIALVCLSVFATAQGKKTIRKFSIKKETETVTEGTTTYKDGYVIYNNNGNPIEEVKYNKDGTIKKKTTSKYDKNNKIIEEQHYEGNKFIKKKIFTYNAFEEKTEELTYDAANQLVKKELYKYDKKGLKIEKKIFDGVGNLQQTHIYTYQTGAKPTADE